ncbi:MAG: pitrilysin family protein [Firmicutes bacterium]|nr:pitrilysin family protein [Bacillota bacterium]
MTWSKGPEHFIGEWRGGLGCYIYPTSRFKTVTMYAAWIRPLSLQDRAYGAVLPQVLKRGTSQWPSRRLMETRLEELYGASFRADVGKLGDKQLMAFHLNVVNGQFLPKKPDTVTAALDFLTDVLDRPRLVDGLFDAAVVEQEKAQVKRQIAALINDKGQYALARLLELVADGAPFGLRKWGTPEEVDAVDAQSLTEFRHRVRQEAPFLFLMVGDVDPDQAARLIQERFGGQRGTLTTVVPYQGQHQGKTVIESESVSQGKLALAYRTGLTAKDADYPALMMYSGILGGFAHSKLFMNVREKASLAYYAYSRLDPAVALMIVGAGIEFSHYEAARQIIEEQVEAMRQGQFTDEEMAFTLKGYVNDILSEEDSPGQLIARQVERQLVGGGLSGQALIDALSRVRREDIERVAQGVHLDTVYFLTNKGEPGHGT